MIKDLLAYQEIDASLKKIETELSGSEERRKAMSAKNYLQGVVDNVNKLDAKAEELNKLFAKASAELEKLLEQKDEIEKAVASSENQTEASYMLKKATELSSMIKAVMDNVNRINEEIQKVLKEYATIKLTTKNAQAQYDEYGKKYNELKASKQQEKEEIEKKLLELKGKVDEALMQKYLKKRTEDKMYPVLFEVNGNVCGACRMELSMSDMQKLKNGEVIECDQCRRLLFKS